LWRGILSGYLGVYYRKEVKVKLLKSIIKGDDHCLFELLITENDI